MVKNHMKRFSMPDRWMLPKKTDTWAAKVSPGAHKLKDSVPVAVALRDYLNVCSTYREGKRILATRGVKVDGKVITDPNRGLGLMDVLELEKSKKFYRVLLDKRGRIRFIEIPKKNSSWKLCKITNKHTVKGGKTQLGLHDGRNILIKGKKAKKYKRGDTLKVALPDQKIMAHYPFKKGSVSFVVGGRHAGEHAAIAEREVMKSSLPNRVTLEGDVSTVEKYVFVVGKKRPVIELTEV